MINDDDGDDNTYLIIPRSPKATSLNNHRKNKYEPINIQQSVDGEWELNLNCHL